VNGPKGSIKVPTSMANGTTELMRDQQNPKDLKVTGDFTDGELQKVDITCSLNKDTGKCDQISYDKNGTLMVNGKAATPPMTTENGTKITSDGNRVIIDTKVGDHFELDKTTCPALNIEGDVSPNRGQGNVHSDLFGDFDDNPNSTWVAKNDTSGGGGAGGGGVGGVGGAGGTGAGPTLGIDPFEQLRKAFEDMATAGTGGADAPPTKGPGADLFKKIKNPDLAKAVLAKARTGGGIDIAKLAEKISDPKERDKFLHALADPSTSLEDCIKGLSKPSEQLAVLKELVGPDKAADFQAKLFSPAKT
jgi:hypothetical protein